MIFDRTKAAYCCNSLERIGGLKRHGRKMAKIKINGLEGPSKMIFDKKHVQGLENSTTVPPFQNWGIFELPESAIF